MARHRTRHTEAGGTADAQDLREIIGANITAGRTEKKVTVEELARAVGISLRLVQKHLAGDNAPGHENLLRYSRFFGKPVSWFFERHEKAAA